MFDAQGRRRDQQFFENDIEPGGDPADQRVEQTPQRRALAVAQELVENQHLAAGADNPGDFGETVRRFGNDGEDQVQDSAVEAGVGERQALGIALDWQEIDRRCAGQGAPQHGPIEVKSDVMMLGRQMRQIEPGTDPGQQDPATLLR